MANNCLADEALVDDLLDFLLSGWISFSEEEKQYKEEFLHLLDRLGEVSRAQRRHRDETKGSSTSSLS